MTEEELLAEVDILRAENSKLKKRVRELEHSRQLDQAYIICLRRQIEWWEVEKQID